MVEIKSEEVVESIISYIKNDSTKKTPSDLEKFIKNRYFCTRITAKKIIHQLILKGELEYIYQYGRTFIDISFDKPVRVSDNIVLKPHNKKFTKKESDIVVNLNRGLSFGSGSHPTTRLSLSGIDWVLNNKNKLNLLNQIALDVGTGSGVLAITAALYGIGNVEACDIDPIAVDESKKNLILNNVESVVKISHQIDTDHLYNYIIANLRYPTLIDLHPLFLDITLNDSEIIFSGIKIEEKNKIIEKYSQKGLFQKIWEKTESGWVGIVFKRQKK